MKFGVMLAVGVGDGFAHAEFTAEAVVRAEQVGFESLWAGEHVVIPDVYEAKYPYTPDGRLPQPPESDFADPLVWLAYAGTLTTTIKLGTGILLLPQRNPVVLAKELATLDRLTGGRVLRGTGVGWMREESEAVGVPFDARGKRTEEFIGAMRTLWTDSRSTFHGEHVSFDSVASYPKPAQASIPIIVGGGSKVAARRAGRLGDGFFPVASTADQLAELIATMRAAAVDAGRDPDAIEISNAAFVLTSDAPIGPPMLDELRRMEELGVQRILVPRLLDTPVGKALDQLDRLAEELIGAY
jgi:probable F420-dependent oxidoreductase